jgi:cell division protein FtsQ
MTLGVFKTILAVAAIGALGWGAYETAAVLGGHSQRVTTGVSTPVVKDVVFATDGVLDRRWIVETLALPKDASLMDLDLYQLRTRLLASGQVLSAELTRNFPSTLTVHVTERSPVARVMAQVGNEPPAMYLVARDGVVFAGVGFDRAMLDTLPWLDGVKLTRQGDRFEPIARMAVVAELLGKAKLEAEHLYKTWQVVSLARLDSDGEILVKSAPVETIRFSVTEDFFRQLARLDALLDKVRERTDAPLREVNLAIGSQVPASFDDPTLSPNPPAKPGARPAAKPAAPALTLFNQTPRTTNP